MQQKQQLKAVHANSDLGGNCFDLGETIKSPTIITVQLITINISIYV